VKILFRVALASWLISGLALNVYFTRVATPAVVRQTRQLRESARSDAQRDTAFRRDGELWGELRMQQVRLGAIWGFIGFLLALRGVHLLFRRADQVSDIERFLATSMALALLVGVPGSGSIHDTGPPVASRAA
jgi:hypothetical protein